MQLLVSVSNHIEARAALDGGADIIDAKDPHAGALGAVSLEAFAHIHRVAAPIAPVSAALGDAWDASSIARAVRDFTEAGATFVKIGFAGIDDAARVQGLLAAARQGASARVVAVAYADRQHSDVPFMRLVKAASTTGVMGILIDTCDKQGPGLRRLVDASTLRAWVSTAREAGLFVAAAGKLTIDDLWWVRACGADIAGVRGAACENGRTGQVTTECVRRLRAAPAFERSSSMRSTVTIDDGTPAGSVRAN
jgi:(5-formylfuran-3-yl)methyl phosphate synthase